MADPLYELKNVATKTFFTDVSARKDEYVSVLEEIYDDHITYTDKKITRYYRLLNQNYSDYPTYIEISFGGNFSVECYDIREKVTLEAIQEEVLQVLDEKKVQVYVKYIVSNLKQVVSKVQSLSLPEDLTVYQVIISDRLQLCIEHLRATYLKLEQFEVASTPKIQWLGTVSQLGTLFFDLWKGQKGTKSDPKQLKPLLFVEQKKELQDFLLRSFVNKKGEPLSPSSFDDFLNSSEHKELSKPISNRIELKYK